MLAYANERPLFELEERPGGRGDMGRNRKVPFHALKIPAPGRFCVNFRELLYVQLTKGLQKEYRCSRLNSRRSPVSAGTGQTEQEACASFPGWFLNRRKGRRERRQPGGEHGQTP
jgi:hypothetical protein